jgi:hypothetical protein
VNGPISRIPAYRNFRHDQEVTERTYRWSMIIFEIVLPTIAALCTFLLLID